MRAGIFNPYLDTLGGGERYTMAIAVVLVKHGYSVDVEWKDISIKEKLEKRFGIDLKDINIVSDIRRGDGYDLCFWVSDGSIPALKARKNFLHFQVPFTSVGGRTLLNKIKLMRIKKIICNSSFTKKIIDKEFGVDSVVLYPPVSVEKFKTKKKENIILNVGRFSELLQAKRQDVLIKAFKKFHKENSGYQLILAGGVEVGSDKYLSKLKEMIGDYPIKIIESPSFFELKDFYGRAEIFWSASGYGIDEKKEPNRLEHFGITVVEAMASGCVPVVYKAGGSKEIIKGGVSGFLWSDITELLKFTRKIQGNEVLRKKMAIIARERSRKYSYERFEKEFNSLL